ncbi:hypothetical protein [Olleya sp. R77988]|uniref:hypothetical protein n=1 Tax=Olleya sp. R77988 TaxID=3093875 RepID=UPI0037C870EF
MKLRLSIYILVFTVLYSCNSIKTATFDQYSYQQVISLKIESEDLIDHATASYLNYSAEVNDLMLDLKKIVEYEKNKPNNQISYAMLKLLADQNKNLLAGFFKRWQTKDRLSKVFTTEAKAQIMEIFDLIIKYEGDKNKVNQNNIQHYLRDKYGF